MNPNEPVVCVPLTQQQVADICNGLSLAVSVLNKTTSTIRITRNEPLSEADRHRLSLLKIIDSLKPYIPQMVTLSTMDELQHLLQRIQQRQSEYRKASDEPIEPFSTP